MKSITSPVVRRRIACLGVFLCLAVVLVIARLFYLQIYRTDAFHDKALGQRLRSVPVDAHRGTIYDRNMNELAVTVSSTAIEAHLMEIKDPEKTAEGLAQVLDRDKTELKRLLARPGVRTWVARGLDGKTARAIEEMNLDGIRLVQRPHRIYPNGKLAAHLLGIVGVDNQGLEGLEYALDPLLAGVAGRALVETDAVGRYIPGGVQRNVSPQDGESVVLTIDKVIQYIAERELARAVEETGSRRGVLLVMDPKTGEVLALAVYPFFDPNHYWDYGKEVRRCVACVDQYEPGSTMKIFVTAAALEEGLVTADMPVDDPGQIRIGGITVRCWRPSGHGKQTFQEALGNSCNPVFAQIAVDKLGPQRMYRYLSAFGFGSRLGIDFPGEASGLLPAPNPSRWGERARWATIGFGQGIAVTPLQLLTATAAIANGGLLMRPYLVRQVLNNQGKVVEERGPEPIRQVISPETAAEVNRLLRSVVADGSGRMADIPGYPVAGKTGTAEVPSPRGGYGSERIASFVGYAPFDEPRLAALVVLYEPQTEIRYGSTLAGPVFSRAVGDMLKYLGASPRGTIGRERGKPASAAKSREEVAIVAGEYNGEEVVVPSLKGLTLRDAVGVLGSLGLAIDIKGSGFVVKQEPAPGTLLSGKGTVTVWLE
ncbi:MAG: penicillin-binding protein [Limnochordia bacterium]|nr:PASTA domain-containing protein [Bacillota bacterium]